MSNTKELEAAVFYGSFEVHVEVFSFKQILKIAAFVNYNFFIYSTVDDQRSIRFSPNDFT